MVAGQLVHTGTRVVLWTDPEGYDAYRVERRFSPPEQAGWQASAQEVKELETPNRYNTRLGALTPEEAERIRGGGWDLRTLRRVVDQFVLHYDACGTSRECFRVLHDFKGLSVHFLLDLDGTIYQTLDVKERAWHATIANSRSVGVEIANIGAYGEGQPNPFSEWYAPTPQGGTRLTIPERFGGGGLLRDDFQGTPATDQPVNGTVQGRSLTQYDFTPEQYEALSHLTAALCSVLPKIRCDYPRNDSGDLETSRLPDAKLERYQGVLGHFHIQTNKVDPGPAFQWDKVISRARRLMRGGFSETADATCRGHLAER